MDGYEFPEFDMGRDANTLACEIELTSAGAWTSTPPTARSFSTPTKLTGFVDQLRALKHAQDGRATLGDPDPQSGDQSGLSIRLQHGEGMLDGFLTDSYTTRLTFWLINIDRAFLRDALAQFAAIAEAFPVRGDITAD